MKKVLPPYVFFFFVSFCHAQSVQLDPTFGERGLVKTDIGTTYNYSNVGRQAIVQPNGNMYLIYESAGSTIITRKRADGSTDLSYGNKGFSNFLPINKTSAAQQPDGKIVVAGYAKNALQYFYNDADFALARINPDGSIDRSFGNNGTIVTDMGTSEVCFSLAIQQDGKIVVVGASVDGGAAESYVALLRYNSNGTLEKNVTSSFEGSNQFASSVVIQPDGKIVVAGSILARFNENLELDSSFKGTGFTALPFNANACMLQSGGKIIISGTTYGDDGTLNFSMARFEKNGAVDDTFGESGIVITDFEGKNSVSTSMSVQTDGGFYVGGYAYVENDVDFVVMRFDNAGKLDDNFSGDGKQECDFNLGKDYINSLALTANGSLVAFGYTEGATSTLVAGVRYQKDGTRDGSFGMNGLFTDHIVQGATIYTCTAIQPDGKVITGGYLWNGANYDFALVRYNSNGNFDNTFGATGIVITGFGNTNDRIRAIALQADGKILVSGQAGDDIALARFNANGTPDISFGVQGKLTTDCGSNDVSNSLLLLPGGKILAGGSSIVRYNPNGTVDNTFAKAGILGGNFGEYYPFNSNDIAVQNDKLLVLGSVGPAAVLARYDLDGNLDMNFGSEGLQFFFDNDSYTSLVGKTLTVTAEGKIFLAGYAEFNFRGINARFVVTKLNEDGSYDETFNQGAMVYTSVNQNSYVNSSVVDANGKITLGGYSYDGSSDNFTLVRYNTDGSLDMNFGTDGVVITQASSSYDRITALALAENKLYAVGYGQFPGAFGVIARYMMPEGGALPVTMLDFTAQLKGKIALLKWKTEQQVALAGFDVERSGNGSSFTAIDYVKASGASTGNYTLPDTRPLNGMNYYRLRIVDKDGKFRYSNIVSVKMEKGFGFSVYPNPVVNTLYIRGNGDAALKSTIRVNDINGRTVKQIPVIMKDNSLFQVDVSTLPKGVYNVQIQTATGTEAQQFVKD